MPARKRRCREFPLYFSFLPFWAAREWSLLARNDYFDPQTTKFGLQSLRASPGLFSIFGNFGRPEKGNFLSKMIIWGPPNNDNFGPSLQIWSPDPKLPYFEQFWSFWAARE